MKTPDRIWLVNMGDEVIWHDDPKPTGYEEAQDSVEYVRVGGQPSAEPEAWMTHHDEPMLFPSESEAASYCGDGEEPVALVRLSDYEALQAECEKLRKDAERYRWLRDKCDRWDGGLVVAKVTEFSLSSWSGDDLNAAIDAAMEKEDKP